VVQLRPRERGDRRAKGDRVPDGLRDFPRVSWRASDRSWRIASFIVAPPRDGATMSQWRGHRPDGEPRGRTLLQYRAAGSR
jgi:hypothetical protein